MRKRHSHEQIAQTLRLANAGTFIVEIMRKLGVHENTYYTWKKRFGWLGTPEMRELRQLHEEDSKLKDFVADLSLDRRIIHEIVSSSQGVRDEKLGYRSTTARRIQSQQCGSMNRCNS